MKPVGTNGIHTDPTVFQYCQTQWQLQLASGDWSGFDACMVPLLISLNQIEGLVTRFSCSGHVPYEKQDGDDRLWQFYISMVYRPEGLGAMIEIYERLCTALRSNAEVRLSLQHTWLHATGDIVHTCRQSRVRALTLRYKYRDSKELIIRRPKLIRQLSEEVNRYLNRHKHCENTIPNK